MLDIKYGVVISCRNEENNIEDSLKALLKQTIKPSGIILIDDCSTDDTLNICRGFRNSNDNCIIFKSNNPRHKIKGYNISSSYNLGMNKLLEHFDVDYILKCDADVTLNNPEYVEKIIEIMESNKFIGLAGGYSDKGRYGIRHISDGARIYRKEALLEAFKRASPNKGYPIMYGHDTFMLWVMNWLKWDIYSSRLQYKDKRPYYRDNYRSVLSGRFHYLNNMPIILEVNHFVSWMLKRRKDRFGQTILFISYLIHHLGFKRTYNKEYLKFNNAYWHELLRSYVRYKFKKLLKTLGILKIYRRLK
jgi:glycosyltransferase involved in cell wall biosynthesis